MGRAALDYLPHYTLEDYDRWEGDWELIDGVPFAMAPRPGFAHQRASMHFIESIRQQLRSCAECQLYPEIEWRIASNLVFQPDLVVICREPNNPHYLDFPPELIIEILSPSTEAKDRGLKMERYAWYGVRFYMLADPQRQQLEAFQLEQGGYRKLKGPQFGLALTESCRIHLPETIDM